MCAHKDVFLAELLAHSEEFMTESVFNPQADLSTILPFAHELCMQSVDSVTCNIKLSEEQRDSLV